MKITTSQKEIAAYRTVIRYLKKGFGGGHTKKHSFDFDMNCANCQSLIVVSFLERTINLIRWWNKKSKSKLK